MAKNDFLKVCNFQILLPQRNVEFFVQDVVLPGFTLGEMAINWMAQNDMRPGENISWNRLNLTVICDEDLKAFKEVYDYIILEKNPETGVIANPQKIYFDAILAITTNKANISHKIRFRYGWISNVGDLMLMTTSMEDEAPTFTLEIVYTYYEFMT